MLHHELQRGKRYRLNTVKGSEAQHKLRLYQKSILAFLVIYC